jgi:hypothetical protein
MEAISSPQAPPRGLGRFLPRGDTLPAADWKKRHRFLVAFLAAHALALPIFAMAMGFSLVDSILEGGLLPGTFALAGLLIPGPRELCAGLVSLGLLSCSALLVYFSGGYIEAHFHFFIVIVILGLYEDWLPFALALVFVELHHGIVGVIDPSAVYNHPSGQEHPWLWAAIHEVGIGTAAVLSIGVGSSMRSSAQRSSPPHTPEPSLPPTTPAAASSAICTMDYNSSSSRLPLPWAPPRRLCPPSSRESERRFRRSPEGLRTCWTSFARFRGASIRPSSPRAASRLHFERLLGARRSRSSSTYAATDG